jgi:hypothetical protein
MKSIEKFQIKIRRKEKKEIRKEKF